MNKQLLDFPLFSLGFRVFFALAGLFALILIALWASIFKGSIEIDNYFPVIYWHGHEMLLGYATAVIAGFLLTAVKSWTGINPIKGEKLFGLCLLWVYGRFVPFYSDLLPDFIIAATDFLFLPVLTYYVSKPLIKTQDYLKLLFVALLLILMSGNLLIHAEILGYFKNTAILGLNLVVGVIISIIVAIAGQLFPMIIERGLKGVMTIRNPLIDWVAIGSSVLTFILIVCGFNGILLTLTALIACVSNGIRAMGWYEKRIWYVPLLWVLYLGYGWIILGFLFIALGSISLVPQSVGIHAFTVGGIGVLTLGMMARVTMSQTGRALKSSNLMAIAFVSINISALFSALIPAIIPAWYSNFLVVSIYCWLAAFSLFVCIYMPMLSSARSGVKAG